jgi:flagellar hook protein FlgE
MSDVNITGNKQSLQSNPDAMVDGNLDQLFGGSDDAGQVGGKPQGSFEKDASGNIIDKNNAMVQSKFPANDSNPNGEEKQTPKSPEELAKQFQSLYDKEKAKSDKLEAELQRNRGIVDFVNQVFEDQDVRRAFIAEVEPELIKPQDPYTFVKEGLAKEFGEDFAPMADARPGSDEYIKSMLYQQRMQSLFNEATTAREVPKTLKDLKESRAKEVQANRQAAEKTKSELMTEMRWTEGDYNNYIAWLQQLQPVNLATTWEKARNTKHPNPPAVGAVPGSVAQQSPNDFVKELNKLFG